MSDGSGRVKTSKGSPRRARGRRGASIVLALLYLVLFSSLALGFYAQTNLGAQVAANEDRVLEAQVASESGLQFLRYHLSRMVVAPTVARDQIIDEVYGQLSVAMDGTANLGTRNVGFVATPGAKAINIPSGATQFISLGPSGAQFRAKITELGAGRLRITSTGRCGGGAVSRSIAMDFVELPRRSPVLDYGLATKGTVELNLRSIFRGSTVPARGSVLATYGAVSRPVELKGGGTAVISGHVYLSHPTGWVNGSGTIAGESNSSNWGPYVHPNTPSPEFPLGDPARFVEYLVGKETLITGSSAAPYLSNIRIRANANPTFSGGGTIEGVILIEAPNQVTFSSGTTVRGVIVSANPTEPTATNKITFNGACNVYGPETLAGSFAPLTTMKGSAIVAPNFWVDVAYAAAPTIRGAVLVKGMTINLNVTFTVDGPVILAGTGPFVVNQDSSVRIAAPAPTAIPTGFRFTHSYAPHPATYLEVAP